MIWVGVLLGQRRRDARGRPGRRLRRDLPDHVHRQHVRPGRTPCPSRCGRSPSGTRCRRCRTRCATCSATRAAIAPPGAVWPIRNPVALHAPLDRGDRARLRAAGRAVLPALDRVVSGVPAIGTPTGARSPRRTAARAARGRTPTACGCGPPPGCSVSSSASPRIVATAISTQPLEVRARAESRGTGAARARASGGRARARRRRGARAAPGRCARASTGRARPGRAGWRSSPRPGRARARRARGRRAARRRPAAAPRCAAREALHRGGDERAARLEVMQVRAARDAGALGHAARRRVRVAVLDEAGDRRVEQRVARRGAALGLAAARESRWGRPSRGHSSRAYLRS